MPKQYLHPSDEEFEGGQLKIYYQVKNRNSQKLGEVHSISSQSIDEENPRLSLWADNQTISIPDPEEAASLIVQIQSTDLHNG